MLQEPKSREAAEATRSPTVLRWNETELIWLISGDIPKNNEPVWMKYQYQGLWLEAINKNVANDLLSLGKFEGTFLGFMFVFMGVPHSAKVCLHLHKCDLHLSKTVWNIAKLPNHPIYWLSVEPASLRHGETWSQSQRWCGYHWYIFHTSGHLQISKAVRTSLGLSALDSFNFVGTWNTLTARCCFGSLKKAK